MLTFFLSMKITFNDGPRFRIAIKILNDMYVMKIVIFEHGHITFESFDQIQPNGLGFYNRNTVLYAEAKSIFLESPEGSNFLPFGFLKFQSLGSSQKFDSYIKYSDILKWSVRQKLYFEQHEIVLSTIWALLYHQCEQCSADEKNA